MLDIKSNSEETSLNDALTMVNDAIDIAMKENEDKNVPEYLLIFCPEN